MRFFLRWLAGIPAYLWSGWGAIASLLLFVAAWEAVSFAYGPLVLPEPAATFGRLWALIERGPGWAELAITARRAMAGLLLAMLAGSLLGLLAGLSLSAALMARPIVTVLLGTPPIAWLVLAMIWFGLGDGTPVFTAFVACLPVVFVGALQGTRTLDHHLKDVARIFR
ncbi:MAG: ABC transporter permease, partial [Rhodocyclaceae bacterium]|nr:ABC transporter permease [Rhodocyclaceae bacterium]